MAKFTIAKKTVLRDANGRAIGVEFAFANDQKLTCMVKDLIDDVKAESCVHGVSQKGGDSYAGAESVEAAYKSCSEVIGALVGPNGSWKRATAAGERLPALTVEALAEAFVRGGKTKDPKQAMEKARAAWDKMDTDQRRALAKQSAIKKIRLELQSARIKVTPEDLAAVGA